MKYFLCLCLFMFVAMFSSAVMSQPQVVHTLNSSGFNILYSDSLSLMTDGTGTWTTTFTMWDEEGEPERVTVTKQIKWMAGSNGMLWIYDEEDTFLFCLQLGAYNSQTGLWEYVVTASQTSGIHIGDTWEG